MIRCDMCDMCDVCDVCVCMWLDRLPHLYLPAGLTGKCINDVR